ncbi:MAG: hypothetical protein AAFN08_12675 [Cyanobacteria bacterium J06559_3]
MPCRLHQRSAMASALFGYARAYQFSDGKPSIEGSYAAIAEWINRDKSIQSGRCRVTPTPI